MTAGKAVLGAALVATGMWTLWPARGEFGITAVWMPILFGLSLTPLGFYHPSSRFKLIVRGVLVTAIVASGLIWAANGVFEILSQSHLRVRSLVEAVTGGLVLAYGLLEVLSFRTREHRGLRYSR